MPKNTEVNLVLVRSRVQAWEGASFETEWSESFTSTRAAWRYIKREFNQTRKQALADDFAIKGSGSVRCFDFGGKTETDCFNRFLEKVSRKGNLST